MMNWFWVQQECRPTTRHPGALTDDARRVVADHGADAAERRVFLLVVANVAQRRAPAAHHVTRHQLTSQLAAQNCVYTTT